VSGVRDIAVIGSGAAGLLAAISASRAKDCVLITDGPVGRSNSMMAQGGLQLPFPTEESQQKFFEDILRSARTELDTTLVRNFVAHVAATVECLEGWGLELDHDERGALVRRMAGGLSEPRIVSVRDQIGPAIIKVLRARLQQCDVEIMPHTRVADLQPKGRLFLLTLQTEDSERSELCARAVVCCSGGITYREAQRRHQRTTNPHNDNHLLFDLLCRLGVTQIHSDYFQYQPFGIVTLEPTEVGKCVPESIINFDVRILDRSGKPIGEIRQDRYTLTRLMFDLAEAGKGVRVEDGSVGFWLTLSDLDPAVLATTFPKVHQYLERRSLIGQDILIFPFLHYYLGGLTITPQCESDIRGLFLAGEITGGLHGRNRLMGNGITDALVHGRLAGQSACAYVAS
jgi:succinate dehydrogenase/fumarate reductase flavoprotein subunit